MFIIAYNACTSTDICFHPQIHNNIIILNEGTMIQSHQAILSKVWYVLTPLTTKDISISIFDRQLFAAKTTPLKGEEQDSGHRFLMHY